MIESKSFKHVVWFPEGSYCEQDHNLGEGWYFWDETGSLAGGPYTTEKEAADELNRYCEWLNKGV
jgi:hypothetical protein